METSEMPHSASWRKVHLDPAQTGQEISLLTVGKPRSKGPAAKASFFWPHGFVSVLMAEGASVGGGLAHRWRGWPGSLADATGRPTRHKGCTFDSAWCGFKTAQSRTLYKTMPRRPEGRPSW